MIHQNLYRGENLAAIEVKDYFKTVGSAIMESFGKKGENISLDVEMHSVELDVDTAIPIGLVSNELLTNSLKYAFEDQSNGEIKISFSNEEDSLYKLEITDIGSACNDSYRDKNSGFGTLLVQLLTAQLGGKLEQYSSDGISVILTFKDQEKSVA